jgi:hypothetical protein
VGSKSGQDVVAPMGGIARAAMAVAGTTGAAAVQLALLELELAGRLVRHAAGRVGLAG